MVWDASITDYKKQYINYIIKPKLGTPTFRMVLEFKGEDNPLMRNLIDKMTVKKKQNTDRNSWQPFYG